MRGTIVLLFAAIVCRPVWSEDRIQGALLSASSVNDSKLESLRREGYNAIVVILSETEGPQRVAELAAAQRIRDVGLKLCYWIEIARNPALASDHPEWMASLQGHPEWRRFYPSAPKPMPGEVIKNFPWVPILYQESFDAHRQRVEALLRDVPDADAVLLNDLQGAPSACGCGHPLCRWTADYGPIKTAKAIPENAAAKFVAAVREIVPKSRVIPVWTTECEQHDGAKDGLCAGVGCFEGTCWRAYCKQLTPLAEEADEIGVLTLFKTLERNSDVYGHPAAWVTTALKSFEVMPPVRGGKLIATSRLIAVLQGYDVTPEELRLQVEHTRAARAGGYIIAFAAIDQRWEPRLVKVKK